MIQMEGSNMSIRFSISAADSLVIHKRVSVVSAKTIGGPKPNITSIILYNVIDKI